MDKPKLLLFEDNVKTGDLTKVNLEGEGFDVTWIVEEGDLDDVISDSFSVIVTDVSINNSSRTGYEIIDDLRRKYKIIRTPIVVYTAKVNMATIEEVQGKLFFRYVDKVNKESNDDDDELIRACKEALEQKKNLVSFDTLETYFENCNIIDEKIDPDDLAQLTFFVDTSALETNRHLLCQLKKQDLEDDLWNVLEDLAWEIYTRYSRAS